MKSWVLYGLSHKLTEAFNKVGKDVKGISNIFKKSLHVFVIDVSNDNELNLEIEALQSPQYNPHRFGIFFTESPRHADVLLVLGKVHPKMEEPLKETINQIPEPFGIVAIEDENWIGRVLKS
jgi:Ni,Fe-hydrogenase III small subunit